MIRFIQTTLISTAVLLVSPGVGQAGTLQVDFRIDSGSFVFGMGQPDLSVGASAAQGAATITLSGVNAMGLATGPLVRGALSGFGLMATNLAFTASGLATPVIGSASVAQIGAAAGGFDGARLSLSSPFVVQLDAGFVFTAGSQPTTVSAMLADAGLGSISLASLGASGMARLQLRDLLATTAGSFLLSLDVAGREVARRFVDEPKPSALSTIAALLGLVGLSAAGLRRRSTSPAA